MVNWVSPFVGSVVYYSIFGVLLVGLIVAWIIIKKKQK